MGTGQMKNSANVSGTPDNSAGQKGMYRSRSELLADVVIQSKDAITVQDLEGKIAAWNKGAEKMYGYSEEEVLGMNISMIIPDDKKAEYNEIIQSLKSGHDVDSLQTTRLTKSGHVIDVWLTITKLLDKEGNVAGIATTERNITEHNKTLEEVESALALAEEYTIDIEQLVAERTASLIALNIADRVINPAVVIGLVCNNLISKGTLNDADRKRLEIIRDESERLQKIVHEFNEFINRSVSFFQYDDLNGIVREAVVMIKKQAEDRGIGLDVSLSESPLMINMNRNVLRTAIFYIFKNALEATDRGGRITARTFEESDSVILIISDTGCGIPEGHITRVFDKFFTTKINGVGMGLPFVKHIIEEHYGNVNLESKEGEGTTCKITFPMRWLKFSDGKLLWEKPMLPVLKEKHEYPLKVKEKSGLSGKQD